MQEAARNRLASIALKMKDNEAERLSLPLRSVELNTAFGSLQAEHIKVTNQTAPISSLPNETLADIFEILHGLQEGKSTPIAELSEIIVSHVISHWRNVALRVPKLWTRIWRKSNQWSLGIIAAYLERSQRLPIDIRVDVGQNKDSRDIDVTYFYKTLIRPHMGRCRHLSVQAPTCQVIYGQLSLFSTQPAPFLESTDLMSHEHDDSKRRSLVPGDLLSGGAPMFTALRLRGPNTQHFCSSFSILPSIKVMWFDDIKHATPFCAANLTHLKLTNLDLFDDSYQSTILPCLLTIAIKVGDARPNAVSEFLMGLTAPSLEAIYFGNLIYEDMDIPWSHTRFPSLHIIALTMPREDMDEPDTRQLATRLPAITHLTYHDDTQKVLSSVLGAEQVDSGTSTAKYWPNLHTLHVQRCTEKDILDLLHSRRRLNAPIKKLLVDTTDHEYVHGICSRVFSDLEIEEITGDLLESLYPLHQPWSEAVHV